MTSKWKKRDLPPCCMGYTPRGCLGICKTGAESLAQEGETEHEHTDDRCCMPCGHHVMPHRGCILR